jgi:hypothetical protein
MPAVRVLLGLKKEGQLPGFSIDDKRRGTIGGQFDSPRSIIAHVEITGETHVYHYRLVQVSKNGAWKLRNAWRTDLNGRLLEEYPVP